MDRVLKETRTSCIQPYPDSKNLAPLPCGGGLTRTLGPSPPHFSHPSHNRRGLRRGSYFSQSGANPSFSLREDRELYLAFRCLPALKLEFSEVRGRHHRHLSCLMCRVPVRLTACDSSCTLARLQCLKRVAYVNRVSLFYGASAYTLTTERVVSSDRQFPSLSPPSRSQTSHHHGVPSA